MCTPLASSPIGIILHRSVVRQAKVFLLAMNERTDDMKGMNENMKSHEEGGLKNREC